MHQGLEEYFGLKCVATIELSDSQLCVRAIYLDREILQGVQGGVIIHRDH